MSWVLLLLMAVLTALSIISGIAALHVLRNLGVLRERLPVRGEGQAVKLSGPPMGPVASDVQLIDDQGVTWTIGASTTEPLLILVLSENCPSCTELLGDLHGEIAIVGLEGRVLLSFDSVPSDLERIRRQYRLEEIPVIKDTELYRRWMIGLVPYAVYVGGAEGIVLSGTLRRFGGLRGLLKSIAEYRSRRVSAAHSIQNEAGVTHA